MKKFFYILLIATLSSCLNESGEDNGIKNYVVEGDAVPSFSVTKGDGTGATEFQSSQFVGKRSVIVFFNSECPDCKREMPKVHAAWEELQDEVEFIAVSRGEKAPDVAAYWTLEEGTKSSFAPMPYYLDLNKVAFNKFANSYVPRIYLIGEDGKVKHFEIETFSFADGAGLVTLINATI